MAEVDKLNTDREIAGAVPTEGKASSTFSVKSKHGGGLRLEVRKCGARRFRYRFRLAGKQCDMDFGYYPATSLKAAREKHEQAVTLVKQGIDPRSVLEAAKVKNLAMPTLRELFDEWLPTKTAANAKPKPISPRTAKDYREAFELHLAPALGKVRVCDLTRSVLFRHLEQIGAKNGTRLALGLLGQVLDRAVDLEYIDANPARSIKPARVGGSAGKPRERWLETDELRLLWRALDRATEQPNRATKGPLGGTTTRSTSFVVADCLRLILFTGVRRSEATGMRFDQIDGDRWTIPETKNGRAHVITLHPLAWEIVERRRAQASGPWVFESTSSAGQPIDPNATTKALIRIRERYLAELEPFTVHDLRRSVSTGCGEYLKAPERLVEKLLNHQGADKLVRTYQVGGMVEDLRKLWLDWGDHLLKNVVQDEAAMPVPDNVVAVNFGGRK